MKNQNLRRMVEQNRKEKRKRDLPEKYLQVSFTVRKTRTNKNVNPRGIMTESQFPTGFFIDFN